MMHYPVFVQYYSVGSEVGMREATELKMAASEGDRFAVYAFLLSTRSLWRGGDS